MTETPQNALEEALVAARDGRLSTEAFLRILVDMPLFLPSGTPVQADGAGFAPVLLTRSGTDYLAVYTTQKRAGSVADTASYCLQVAADWVFKHMPAGSGIVINAGFAIGGQVEPQTVQDIIRDFLPGGAGRQAAALCRVPVEHKVNSLCFLPDTLTLLGGTNNGNISQWHYTGTLDFAFSFSAETTRIFQVAVNQAGTQVAAAGRGPLRLWRLPEGALDWKFQFEDDSFTTAAFSPDGARLLAAGDEEELHIISLQEKNVEFGSITKVDPDNGSQFALGERTSSLAFHPDGKTLLAACSWQGGSALKFCELDTELRPRPEWTLRFPADILSPAAFSPSGGFFAFADWEVSVYSFPARERVFSFNTQGESVTPPQRGKSAIVDVSWSNAVFTPDGQTLLCGSPSGTIFLWDLPSGRLRQALPGHEGGVVCLSLNPAGTLLASSGQDKTLRLWQMPGGEG